MRLWIVLVVLLASLVVARSHEPFEASQGPSEVQAAIVNGYTADSKRYPWIANIRLPSGGLCTGVWVGQKSVVTAMHCVEGVDPRDVVVSFGGSKHDVAKITRPRKDLDIAILKLERKANVTPISIMRVADAPRFYKTGRTLHMLGYGKIQENPAIYSYKPQEVSTKVLRTKEEHIFVSNPSASACGGDSGGPLFVKGRSPESDILVGIYKGSFMDSKGAGCSNGAINLFTSIFRR